MRYNEESTMSEHEYDDRHEWALDDDEPDGEDQDRPRITISLVASFEDAQTIQEAVHTRVCRCEMPDSRSDTQSSAIAEIIRENKHLRTTQARELADVKGKLVIQKENAKAERKKYRDEQKRNLAIYKAAGAVRIIGHDAAVKQIKQWRSLYDATNAEYRDAVMLQAFGISADDLAKARAAVALSASILAGDTDATEK